MAGRLEGKVAIVTGASRGIGAAIARAFAAEGAARVIISSRKLAGLEAQAETIHADYPDTVSPRTCHMGDEDQITALIDWVEAEYGTPQILINNAGILHQLFLVVVQQRRRCSGSRRCRGPRRCR